MKTKYLTLESLKLINKVLPKLHEVLTFRIVQACTLAMPENVDSRFNWWQHNSTNSISNKQYWAGRVGLECYFGNQVIGLSEFAKRSYTYRFFKQKEMEDFYNEYHFGREHMNKLQSKTKAPYPTDFRNMFIYADSLRREDLLEIEGMRVKDLYKIVCFPAEQGIQVDVELEQFCLDNKVRLLPMKELSVEKMLRYITKNTRGNILINELPDGKGDYITNPTDEYLQPRRLLLFCNELPKEELKACSGQSFQNFKLVAKSYYYEKNSQLNKLSIMDLTRDKDHVPNSEQDDSDLEMDEKQLLK